jgi:hypothetical protein
MACTCCVHADITLDSEDCGGRISQPRLVLSDVGVYCRVRRKRERLTSNGSIEPDAAVRLDACDEISAPRHFR